MEEREGCLINVTDLAFLMLVVAKAFFSADIEWWAVFMPLVFGFVYDIVELILKMHNKSKK